MKLGQKWNTDNLDNGIQITWMLTIWFWDTVRIYHITNNIKIFKINEFVFR